MSGPLLIGIAAVGAVWVLGSRQTCAAKANAAGVPAPMPPDPAPVGVAATDGVAAILGSSEAGDGRATIGGDTSIGVSSGGSSLPVNLGGPDGLGRVQVETGHSASVGGADPSTLRSTVGVTDKGDSPGDSAGLVIGDDPKRPMPSDPVALWLGATHGTTEGLTKRQIAAAYNEVQIYTGQVVI